mmetsp:Transcript_108787/g.307705  ORF Transcript_108787/g.307705 Transcript_108787/m.307705 type:complete len:263 (+) Transcript_108787:279-1067(+)
MCMSCGWQARWMLCPDRMRTSCPSLRSSHMQSSLEAPLVRRPSASYGTRARLSAGHVGARALRELKPSSWIRRRNTSSDLLNRRSVMHPSCTVCCRLMQAAPSLPLGASLTGCPLGSVTGSSRPSKRMVKAPAASATTSPPNKAAPAPGNAASTREPTAGGPGGGESVPAAGRATSLSEGRPPRLVPSARTKSAVSASSSSRASRHASHCPPHFTTGLLGSNQLPWISLIRSCGKPAFWGSPSWFCCTQPWMRPSWPRKARA